MRSLSSQKDFAERFFAKRSGRRKRKETAKSRFFEPSPCRDVAAPDRLVRAKVTANLGHGVGVCGLRRFDCVNKTSETLSHLGRFVSLFHQMTALLPIEKSAFLCNRKCAKDLLVVDHLIFFLVKYAKSLLCSWLPCVLH